MTALANFGHQPLLTLIQQACSELNLQVPQALFGNPDLQVQQLVNLAQREAREMYNKGTRIGGWQVLRKETVWTLQSTAMFQASYTQGSNIVTMLTAPASAPQVGWTVTNSANATAFPYPTTVTAVNGNQITLSNAALSTNTNTAMAIGQDTYALPADINYFIAQTFWDRTYRWQMLGPLSPQEWQTLKSGISPTGPRRRFRIFAGNFVIDPVPSDNAQLVYEYYSVNWCQSATGTLQPGWKADTDLYLLDDTSLVMGLIWRFRRAKGFEYEQEQKDYNDYVDGILSRQSGARTLPINSTSSAANILSDANVPDTGFGS